ncbi:MAG: diacylglycerol/lipid kinase family protein [Opitutales bacterium]
MKLRFIFNPRSGHNARSPYLLTHAREFIQNHRLDATVVATEHPRHATELARRAVEEGCEVVVAIGGDGTMNEVATALIDTPATLALIPCGSGNGLGRHLGIPGPGRGAFRNLLDGRPRLIDTGMANDRPFFNAMGLGFDAEISDRFTRVVRRGFPAYVRTTLAAWRSFRPVLVTITGENRTFTSPAFLVAVANSDQYGNNFLIAPGARVDDGQLNLTLLKPVGILPALPLVLRFFQGKIDGSAHVERMQDRSFEIVRPEAGLIHTDGEAFRTDARVSVRVRPRSLRVLVPPGQVRGRS